MDRDRDEDGAAAALERLRSAAVTDENLMPPLIDCARAYCTEGEIVDALSIIALLAYRAQVTHAG